MPNIKKGGVQKNDEAIFEVLLLSNYYIQLRYAVKNIVSAHFVVVINTGFTVTWSKNEILNSKIRSSSIYTRQILRDGQQGLKEKLNKDVSFVTLCKDTF